MRVTFRKSFTRDLKKIKDQAVLIASSKLSNRQKLRPLFERSGIMSGTVNFYRIRVGEYRIGIIVEGDNVDFVRCLPRRDLYRFFP